LAKWKVFCPFAQPISVLQDEKLELIDISQIIENKLLQAPATVREVSDKYAHRHFDHLLAMN
jgi:hypothetical protein